MTPTCIIVAFKWSLRPFNLDINQFTDIMRAHVVKENVSCCAQHNTVHIVIVHFAKKLTSQNLKWNN